MKKIFILLIVSIFSYQITVANQWIIFHAEEGIIGHAFATFVQEDAAGKLNTIGTFGMNTGGFEVANSDIGYSFYLELDDKLWEACLNTLYEWNSKRVYIPIAQDCVAFIKALLKNYSQVSKPPLVYVFPSEYIEQLKALNSTINSKSKTSLFKAVLSSVNTVKSTGENEAIKQAAINFYRWYEIVWTRKNPNLQYSFVEKMLMVQIKKVGSIYKKYCPCQIKWNIFEDYCKWVLNLGAPISTNFFSVWLYNLQESENALRQDKEERLDDDGGKDLWFYESCFFENAQDSPQGYATMGFYDNRCMWDIQINSDGTAIANNTFKTNADWGGNYAFKVKLVKENSTWKVASPFEPGVVNPAFKAAIEPPVYKKLNKPSTI